MVAGRYGSLAFSSALTLKIMSKMVGEIQELDEMSYGEKIVAEFHN